MAVGMRERVEKVLARRRIERFEIAAAGEPTISFSELVWAHWRWEWQRHFGSVDEAVEREYRRCLTEFEARFGEVRDAYWSITDASAVVLTIKHRRRAWGLVGETVPRVHLVFDWVTREEPEIATVLNACSTLAIRVGEVLRGPSELIALRRIVDVASHLLGFVDRMHGRPGGSEVLAFADLSSSSAALNALSRQNEEQEPRDTAAAKRARGRAASTFARQQRRELAQVDLYFHRAGNKQARIIYFWGMVLGYLWVVPLSAATVGLIWLIDNFSFENDHATRVRLLLACIAAGPLGAILSVLTRIASSTGKFDLDYEVGRKQVRWLGVFRPLIGAIFGAASFLLVSGTVLQAETAKQNIAYYAAIAFLSGFFERFMKIAPGGAPEPVDPDHGSGDGSDAASAKPPARATESH